VNEWFVFGRISEQLFSAKFDREAFAKPTFPKMPHWRAVKATSSPQEKDFEPNLSALKNLFGGYEISAFCSAAGGCQCLFRPQAHH
jgi:hypothetical protein